MEYLDLCYLIEKVKIISTDALDHLVKELEIY